MINLLLFTKFLKIIKFSFLELQLIIKVLDR
jgi:hypothetical protein